VSLRAALAEARVEAVFVVLCAVGMASGLAMSWLGAPPAATWAAWTVAYVFGGWYGLVASIEALTRRRVEIDLLMILAALGALVIDAPFEGAMLLFLFSLSNVLQAVALGRSRHAIQALMQLRPDTATVRRGDDWVTIPVDEAEIGDVFVVRPGDRLPLDGVVATGESAVDQATLTGESVPVDKQAGAEVFAGTINGSGSLEVRVTKPAGQSTLARMIELVEEAQSQKAETQRIIDRLEQPYALGVIGMTVAAVTIPTVLFTEAFDPAFYRAMTLMVAASPCALVISTPAAVLSAIANAARRGILFKGGAYVEAMATIKAVAFDKTGTLTEGRTRLTDLIPLVDSISEDDLLALSAAVQARSEHHLAKATIGAAQERLLEIPEATDFLAEVGLGVRATVNGSVLHIGNPRYFESWAGDGRASGAHHIERLQAEAKTAVLVARERGGSMEALGVLAFADTLRPDAAAVIRRLRDLGIERIVMVTGDNQAVAERIAAEAGVDEVYAEVLPERKVEIVRELRERIGPTAMVGDGVNDAPALAAASLGIAMGAAGTDVALETADLVLMSDDLDRIAYALALSRRTRQTLMVNLGVAFGVIAVMVASILAVGLPLPLAVVGHEGSTVLVSLNGLRLLGFQGTKV
jgi:Zn2+/Cd2+-exporting ATPase